jgi:DNA-binding transcriptional MerR regulator
MQIGELSKRTGLPQSTIRQYINDGLLRAVKGGRESRTRRRPFEFKETAVNTVIMITALWDLGLELKERKSVLTKLKPEILKEKIQKLPYLELLKFFQKQGVKLEERSYLERFLSG